MIRLILFTLSLLCVTYVYGAQIKEVVDEDVVTAKISSIDITRILVQGDRIKGLKGIKGAYTHENDESKGEVYLQPTALYQNSAFTVLVETEQGRHFTLLLTPVAVPGGTLMLVPKGVGRNEALRFEKASDYEVVLSRLVCAMAKDLVPEGYSVTDVTHTKNNTNFALGKTATLHLTTIYQGLHFQVQVYELTNSQSVPIQLDERQFYKLGTRAISLESRTVPPHRKIKIIRVVGHG